MDEEKEIQELVKKLKYQLAINQPIDPEEVQRCNDFYSARRELSKT